MVLTKNQDTIMYSKIHPKLYLKRYSVFFFMSTLYKTMEFIEEESPKNRDCLLSLAERINVIIVKFNVLTEPTQHK